MGISAHGSSLSPLPKLNFRGASPDLTARFYTQLLPSRNDEVVFQVRQHLQPSAVTVSKGRSEQLFTQDAQWVFEEPDSNILVKTKPNTELLDSFAGATAVKT